MTPEPEPQLQVHTVEVLFRLPPPPPPPPGFDPDLWARLVADYQRRLDAALGAAMVHGLPEAE